MMATSPLFSATLITSHPHWTYIRPPSEFILYSDTTNNHHSYHCHYQPAPCTIYHSTTRAPPCSTHIPWLRPIISCTHQFSGSWVSVATRTCEDLSQHPLEYESFHYMFHSATICYPKYLLICLSLLEGDYSVVCRITVECIAKPLKSAHSRIIDCYLILPKCKR